MAMKANVEKVSGIGSELLTAGNQLTETMGNVTSVVEMIRDGAFEGDAPEYFADSYSKIQPKLEDFAQWMQNMGKSITTSAENMQGVDKAGRDAIVQ